LFIEVLTLGTEKSLPAFFAVALEAVVAVAVSAARKRDAFVAKLAVKALKKRKKNLSF